MVYQLMPPLSADEYAALKADIATRGVQVPVEYDEDGNILDGYHRVRACAELGLEDWSRVVRVGLTEEQKVEHAVALNLARRHLGPQERVQVEADLRRRGWSLRRIADVVKVEPSTVMRDLRGVANATPERAVGTDGKVYPAHRPVEFLNNPATWLDYRKSAAAPTPEVQPVPAKVEAESGEVATPSFLSSPGTSPPAPPPLPQPNHMAVHYSSERQDWATPQKFFDRLNTEFQFDIDVCATPGNAKCGRFFTPETDGLAQRWEGACWMNPPYGNEIADWMRKAYVESRQGATVVCLVPSRTDTHWWHSYAMKAAEIRFIRGRLTFEGADTSAPFPSAIVVLRPEVDGPPAVKGVWADDTRADAEGFSV